MRGAGLNSERLEDHLEFLVSNPVLCLRRLLLQGDRVKVLEQVLNQLVHSAGYRSTSEQQRESILKRLEAGDREPLAGLRPERRPGVVGLLITYQNDQPSDGIVDPLHAVLDGSSPLDGTPSRPWAEFTRRVLSLFRLPAALRSRFWDDLVLSDSIRTSRKGWSMEGQSMDVAGVLAALDARSGHKSALLECACALVQLSPDDEHELCAVDFPDRKLQAFEREFGRGSLLVRHPDCAESARFERIFDRTWQVSSLEDLCDRLVEAHPELQQRMSFDAWRDLLERHARVILRDQHRTPETRLASFEKLLDLVHKLGSGRPPEIIELEESTATPTLELLTWLWVQRATSNQQRSALDARIREVADALYGNEPMRVLEVEGWLARASMEDRDFDSAARWLRRYTVPRHDFGSDGKKLARTLKNLGDLQALQGNLDTAWDFYTEALEGCEGSRDNWALRDSKDILYALALIATDQKPPNVALRSVERFVASAPLSTQLAQLAQSPAHREHHAALRYVVKRGAEQEKRSYWDAHKSWQEPVGSLAPFISFYRALLARQLGEDFAWWLHAAERSALAGSSPILKLAGGTFAVIEVQWAPDSRERAGKVLDELSRELPHAAPALAELRDALVKEPDPIELLQRVVPFRFH